MKGDENVVLDKAEVVWDLPKNLKKPMKICTYLALSKDDVVFDSPKKDLNAEEC